MLDGLYVRAETKNLDPDQKACRELRFRQKKRMIRWLPSKCCTLRSCARSCLPTRLPSSAVDE
jgi:hypothetical protein